jgi:hypothetical protein
MSSVPTGGRCGLNFIKSITVSDLQYPLYDDAYSPRRYFKLGRCCVWQCDDGGFAENAERFPAALRKDATFDIALSETEWVRALLAELPGPYLLTATFAGQEIVCSGWAKTLHGFLDGLWFDEVKEHGRRKSLPWVFHGPVLWALTSEKSNITYVCETFLEVYILPEGLPLYFHRSGIPLALLRLPDFLSSWMSHHEEGYEQPTDWPAYVVNLVFHSPKLEYETFSGSCKYTSWTHFPSIREIFISNGGIDCWLDLWLADTKASSESDMKHQVNCYDLAAICQVLISLGVENSARTVRMKYMQPFGFIKPTRLIGREETPPDPIHNPRNECNNPIYRRGNNDPRMLCDDYSPNRSQFGNHLFVTVDTPRGVSVLDACCGPQLGATLLQDYPGMVIDARPDLYDVQTRPDPGGLGDITDGIGVADIVTCHGFVRGAAGATTLLDTFATALEPAGLDGRWLQPSLASPAGNWTVKATWTFLPRGHGDQIRVDITKYDMKFAAESAFERLASLLPGFVPQVLPEIGDGGYSDERTGSIWIIRNSGLLYTATIESQYQKAQSIRSMAIALGRVVNASLICCSNITLIESASLLSSTPISVGSEFSVKLEVSLHPKIMEGALLKTTIIAYRNGPQVLERIHGQSDPRGT